MLISRFLTSAPRRTCPALDPCAQLRHWTDQVGLKYNQDCECSLRVRFRASHRCLRLHSDWFQLHCYSNHHLYEIMSDNLSSITDLPLDILVLIFPYLDAKSFLALCGTCRGFQQSSIRLDPAYWSFATRSTFRVPNQPVVQHDGIRWQKMYRRLLTQSRVYTWGCNSHSRLGHSYGDVPPRQNSAIPRMLRPGRIRAHVETNCSYPTEMEDTRDLGIIADMQCG